MMLNRDVFQKDPTRYDLANNGVVHLGSLHTQQQRDALRFELETFVCEGQYQAGMVRILESFLHNLNQPTQPAVWVNGFFGSGKSHLLKMFWHLWVNTPFPDGNHARNLAQLPEDVQALLLELDNEGKRHGGLHAAAGQLTENQSAGTLGSALGILFRSLKYPAETASALFCLWLKKEGYFEKVKKTVEARGASFEDELIHLYVSPKIAQALLDANPDFASSEKEVRSLIRAQFPPAKNISTEELVRHATQALGMAGRIPLTAVVLDEVQLFIGQDHGRSKDVQDLAEALTQRMEGRVLLVGAGQTALAAENPLLSRLRDRFTVQITLTDRDVERVTQRVVLTKKPNARKAVEEVLEKCAGEVERQLSKTQLRVVAEDRKARVDEYPLLPTRRRFWELALKAVDRPGHSSQLRSQLRIVFEAARKFADSPLGHVVPGDFLFEQQQDMLLNTQALLRTHHEKILGLDDGSEKGGLKRRIAGLVWLLRQVRSRGEEFDNGLRVNAECIADLMVSDLAVDGPHLREVVPKLLVEMADEGALLRLEEGEYSIQTREGMDWDASYQRHLQDIQGNYARLVQEIQKEMESILHKNFGRLSLNQGETKTARKMDMQVGAEVPPSSSSQLPLWIQDGWSVSESEFIGAIRALEPSNPTVGVFIDKRGMDDALKTALLSSMAANRTLQEKGHPSTPEGQEARIAMETRLRDGRAKRDHILQNLVEDARAFLAGGEEISGLTLEDRVLHGMDSAMARLFPRFSEGDHKGWKRVYDKAKRGDANALREMDFQDKPESHPQCAEVLRFIGRQRSGKDVRTHYEAPPFGWPRDTVDAILAVLAACGKLRIDFKGTPLPVTEFDQGKVTQCSFQVESYTLGTRDRIAIRGLYGKLDIACPSGQEEANFNAFCRKADVLCNGIIGQPPKLDRYPMPWLEEAKAQIGMERLRVLVEYHSEAETQLEELKGLSIEAPVRMESWQHCQSLLAGLGNFDGITELQDQVRAIAADRSLFAAHNPLQSPAQELAKKARAAWTECEETFEKTYRHTLAVLARQEPWPSLPEEKQKEILQRVGIVLEPRRPIDTEAKLAAAYAKRSREAWLHLCDALPKKAADALREAAKLLEPKSQTLRLHGGSIRDQRELERWLAEAKARIEKALEEGPVFLL